MPRELPHSHSRPALKPADPVESKLSDDVCCRLARRIDEPRCSTAPWPTCRPPHHAPSRRPPPVPWSRPRRTRAAHTRRRAPDRTGGRRPPRPARARAIARGARPVGATRRGAGRLGPRLKALLRVAVHAREGELLFRFVRRGRPPDLLLRWRVGRRACTTGSLAAISLFAAAFGMRTRGQGAIFVPLDVNTSAEQCHRNRRTDLHHPLPSPLHLLARLPPPAFMRNRNCSDLRSGQRLERSRDNQVMLRASKRRSLGMLGYRKYSNVVS